jgi:hypothetical protein
MLTMSPRALLGALAALPTADEAVVMRLQGELGNQLFQFAAGTSLARRLECPLRFDVEHHQPVVAHCVGDAFVPAAEVDLLRCAELRSTAVEQWVRTLQLRMWLPLRRRLHRPERHLQLVDSFRLDPRVASLTAPCFVRGYLQNLGLFRDVLDQVVDLVLHHLGEHPSSGGADTPVVGVHFRRTDYLDRGWELPMEYYAAALAIVDQSLGPVVLRVFADDDLFAQLMVEHLMAEGRKAEVAVAVGDHGHPAVDALVAMARCDHLVIANSTFSWWGAALGDRLRPDAARLVITPERWRVDRPPPDLALPGWRAVAL